MDADEMALREQIETHKKRLRILEKRAALQGINTPPESLIEIDEIKGKIQKLKPGIPEVARLLSFVDESDFDLKYFIYVSDAKLEMLHPQLLGTSKYSDLGENRYTKLKSIIKNLEERGRVGTIDNPKSYFKGVLPMRWGLMDDSLLFVGETDHKVICMGGSSQHITGSQHANPLISYRNHPSLTNHIVFNLQQLTHASDISSEEEESASNELAWLIAKALRVMEGPIEKLEFFAKKLIINPNEEREFILGTPLYVALAD